MTMTDSTIICDTSTGVARPVVPASFCHCIPVPSGIRATQKFVTTHSVWPGINSDVLQWHTVTQLSNLSSSSACFNKILYVDAVRPLPSSRGYTFILACIDHFTRWPEAFPLQIELQRLLLVFS